MDFGQEVSVMARAETEGERTEGETQIRRPLANFAKLTYQKLFYQSHDRIVDNKKVEGNHIAVMRIAVEDQQSALQAFYAAKEVHEKGIRRFKAQYHLEEGESKRRRRGYSIDTEATGAYHLNNWLSHEKYVCEQLPTDEKTAMLVYELLAQRWSKALEITATLPPAPHSAVLQYLLTGFKAISVLLGEDAQLADQFLRRPTYQIVAMKSSSDSVGGNANFVNAFEEDAKSRFQEIRSLPRKVQILRLNMDYLVKFAGSYRPAVEDGYLQLAFRLLGNTHDQEGAGVPPEHDFLKLLLRLDLRLSDRLNFGVRLLGERRRREMCGQLEERLSAFPRLDNILFYTAPPLPKAKEERIGLICRAYLDQHLDLQTVAGLAQEFPSLRKYRAQFRQALELSGEHAELERFQQYTWGGQKEGVKEEGRGRRTGTFLECVSVAQERIGDWKMTGEAGVVCEICCKKLLRSETLLECGKCRHGGHFNHLLKWFQEYENCPHIGCPCLCN